MLPELVGQSSGPQDLSLAAKAERCPTSVHPTAFAEETGGFSDAPHMAPSQPTLVGPPQVGALEVVADCSLPHPTSITQGVLLDPSLTPLVVPSSPPHDHSLSSDLHTHCPDVATAHLFLLTPVLPQYHL